MAKRDGLFRRGEIWWIRKDPVTGKQVSTRFRDFTAAQLFRAERERQAADPAHAAQEKETLYVAVHRLITMRENAGKSAAFHETKLGHWLRIFGDHAPIGKVGTPEAFDRFVDLRRIDGVKNHTISKEVTVMTNLLWLEKRLGLYAGDPTILRPPNLHADYVARERSLTADEVAALITQLTPERAAFVAVCVGLGLRKGEAFKLTPEDVDTERGLVHVRGSKTKLSRRTVPILEPFRGLVLAAVPCLPLRRWIRGNYLRDLAAACERAGIERCTPNDFRRTHATLLRNAGVRADVVRGLLGHSAGSNMLERVYDRPTMGELVERVGNLGELTQQMDSLVSEIPSRREGFRTPDIRLVRTKPPIDRGYIARISAAVDARERPAPTGEESPAQHSPAAHALALAFASVLARGVA